MGQVDSAPDGAVDVDAAVSNAASEIRQSDIFAGSMNLHAKHWHRSQKMPIHS